MLGVPYAHSKMAKKEEQFALESKEHIFQTRGVLFPMRVYARGWNRHAAFARWSLGVWSHMMIM